MEGHYETHAGAPLILFGLPDDAAETTRYALEIPRLGSLILTHSLDGEVRGLKAFPRDERPPAALIFWTFRVMVALGLPHARPRRLGGLAALAGAALRRPLAAARRARRWGRRASSRVLCGWITTEVGRQPWTVYGLLRTADSVSPIEAPAVATSLTAFVVVYFAVFGAGIFYLLRLMRRPPAAGPGIEELGLTRTAGITPGPAEGRPGH